MNDPLDNPLIDDEEWYYMGESYDEWVERTDRILDKNGYPEEWVEYYEEDEEEDEE